MGYGARCKATEDLHNGEITTWQTALSQKNVELTEATGSLNTNTEEQSERQAEKQMLENESAPADRGAQHFFGPVECFRIVLRFLRR